MFFIFYGEHEKYNIQILILTVIQPTKYVKSNNRYFWFEFKLPPDSYPSCRHDSRSLSYERDELLLSKQL